MWTFDSQLAALLAVWKTDPGTDGEHMASASWNVGNIEDVSPAGSLMLIITPVGNTFVPGVNICMMQFSFSFTFFLTYAYLMKIPGLVYPRIKKMAKTTF